MKKIFVTIAALALFAMPAQSKVIWDKIESTHTEKALKSVYQGFYDGFEIRLGNKRSVDVNVDFKGPGKTASAVKLTFWSVEPDELITGLTEKFGQPVGDDVGRTPGGRLFGFDNPPMDQRVFTWRTEGMMVRMTYEPLQTYIIKVEYRLTGDAALIL